MFRILALSDFSQNAYKAIGVAMQLAQHYGGEVIFTHVMSKPFVPATAPQSLYAELFGAEQAKCQEKLIAQVQQLFQELQIRHREVMYQVKVMVMPFMESVMQLAAQQNADLVVMGNTGLSGLQRIIFGSNTEQMIKRTTRPLLIIPEEFEFKGFLNTTFVIRPPRFTYRSGINLALRFARSYGSRLHLLFVVDDASEKPEAVAFLQQHQLGELAQEFTFDASCILKDNKIKDIKKYADATDTDLLVVFPSTKSFWEDLFSDSITHELAFSGTTPLLVLPKDEEPAS